MKQTLSKKILNECKYFAKVIGRESISPNIFMYVLALDPQVQAELMLSNVDIKILFYLLNPYHIKQRKVRNIDISWEVKELLGAITTEDTYLTVFFKSMKHKYIRDIFSKAGYLLSADDNTLLAKYTKEIIGGVSKSQEIAKYKKVRNILGKKNVMILGATGSGRYEFIRNFARHYQKDFSIYYFDLFKYLKIEEDRLFSIISGVFEDLGDNYIYIPNFLQTVEWVKALKLEEVLVLLDALSAKGKIITKTAKNTFDSIQFQTSVSCNFQGVVLPPIQLHDLIDILSANASVYEKFYNISVTKQEISHIIKEANSEDNSLAQPGKSLKRLMRLALVKYGKSNSLLEEISIKHTDFDSPSLLEILNKEVIGQEKALSELMIELSRANFLEGSELKCILFQGEIGCGKLKAATVLANVVFGYDSLRYIDLRSFHDLPFRLTLPQALDEIVASLCGGIVYLDNIDYLDTSSFDILSYLKEKIKLANVDDIMAPVLIIASTNTDLSTIDNFSYFVERFDRLIQFNKLTFRDLEKIAQHEVKKVQSLFPDKELNPFLITARADSRLNALGIKKSLSLLVV